IVPDLAIGHFNVRATTAADQKLIDEIFAKAAEEVGKRDGITVTLHGSMNFPPKPLDPRSAVLLNHILACGRDLGLVLLHRPSGGASDGNKLAAAGLPAIDSLGPVGGDLHSDREYLRIDSLAERTKFTTLLLLKLASG